MRLLLPLLFTLSAPAALQAQALDFGAPAVQTATQSEQGASLRIATGRWQAGSVPGEERAGLVDQTAWRIDTDQSTLDLAQRLRAQLLAEGWREVFACDTDECGGFDFRYALPLIMEPDMHVDLGDFRYIALRKGDAMLSLTISRARMAAFVQLTRVSGALMADAPAMAVPDTTASQVDRAQPAAPPLAPQPVGQLGARLENAGSVVLDGVNFASGKAELQGATPVVLTQLADYLKARPDARIALVGHTDASGGLAGNIALSKARAQAVRKALIAQGISADRIEAEGVGYLAPRVSNLSPEGRTQNRRVEVMLTSTQIGAAP
ncbi:OmpA family protein [Gemmobacter serpentinus]|uniref:OmpA family protein n=1 Tax=Gemmobacter serpentinus TaxID=2652247 RepID=UPI00124E8227|nr:OmpA family protein [Gemmobacter serpentinus]